MTTVPNSPAAGIPEAPPLFDISGRYTEFDSEPMTLCYAGPIPRELEYSLDKACPAARTVRYIYILGGPMGCVYIGQTYSPARRIISHRKKSRFWRHVTHATIYRHVYSHTYPTPDAEIVELERCLISELVPVFNLDRSLAEVDRDAPWSEGLIARNSQATQRALRLLGRR